QQRQPSQPGGPTGLQQHTTRHTSRSNGQVPAGHQHRLRQIRGGTGTAGECGLEQGWHRAEGHAPQDRCQQQCGRVARPQ
ncbi:hypothetical protein, partial [Enterobacter hormaechei]|uniref:hypothetical protein n=1 Tax=Enterobacter hormaechei TaxID=158836 RepID=UPI0027E457F2